MKSISLCLLSLMLSTLCLATDKYNYPIDDPFVATVIGTPKDYVAQLPKKINSFEKSISIFPNRPVKRFFPSNKLNYSLVAQDREAPLIFSIAGTGASHRSAKMQLLEKAFFQAGFHVVSLPSPTFSNFIVNASSTQVPGHIVGDSKDLYRVMVMIKEQISNKLSVSQYHLTGYSLGGAQAAFVNKLDDEQKSLNFQKVLMVNPPVNLFNSVSILDKLLVDNIPAGEESFNSYFNELMADFTKIYKNSENIDFNDDFLYRIYQEGDQVINNNRVSALIGMSFRLSSSNMIFTSDIATNGGYILPKNQELDYSDSTTNYFKVASKISFSNYFDERFYPFYSSKNHNMSKADLIYATSLTSITDYLSAANNISVVHNADDIILGSGEIDFFRDTFKSRAKIYPKGGHLGNMAYKDNIKYMVDFFNGLEQ
jgi:hypothetical protein